MSDIEKPLAGVVVVEHARGVAAQYCARLLAVMGATVIKVEPPQGNALRRQGPFLDEGQERSALFEYLNADKLSIVVDLTSEQGRAKLASLLDNADLLVDDTARLARAAIGLDPETVRQRHPGLNFVSILPFGAEGAHADYVGTELNLVHAGGEAYLLPNGLSLELHPDRPPVKMYGHFAEFVGGTTATCAAITALLSSLGSNGSTGRFVDVAVQDANMSISCMAIQRYATGTLETRHNRSFKYGGVIECADGFVELLVLEQHQWLALLDVMGNPSWVPPEFIDPLERGRRGAEINVHIRAWARNITVAEFVRKGQEVKVPVAPYNTPAQVLATAIDNGRDAFSRVDIGDSKNVPFFTAPFQFVGEPLSIQRAAPGVGADEQRVWELVESVGAMRARPASVQSERA